MANAFGNIASLAAKSFQSGASELATLQAEQAARQTTISALQAQANMDAIVQMGTTTAMASFVQLKAEGASTQKALAVSLLAGLKASVPVYVAKILGESLATNPILWAIIAAGTTSVPH